MNCLVCKSPVSLCFKSEKNISINSNSTIQKEGICIYKCSSCQHLQKRVDKNYLEAVRELYSNYNIYDVSGREEQVKFLKDGLPLTRSSIIIENIKSYLPSSGKLLEIGSGNGAFLKACGVALKGWELYAQDVHENRKKEIISIPDVKDFFGLPLSKIKGEFDLVSLIHSFEHMDQPAQVLKEIKTLLKKDGLLIQVPNINENILDGMVYDHISHFTPAALAKTAGTVFGKIIFPDNQIYKEITLLASSSGASLLSSNKSRKSGDSLTPNLEGLNTLIRDIGKISKPSAVFGTSYVGALAGHLLGGNLAFFVDEDKNRKGKFLLGKGIYHPSELSPETDILLPFIRNQASQIRERWKALSFINL